MVIIPDGTKAERYGLRAFNLLETHSRREVSMDKGYGIAASFHTQQLHST